jgi:hypothetical protein
VDGEWESHYGYWTPYDWDQLFSEPDDLPECVFCDRVLDDRRLAAVLTLQKSWSPGISLMFAHVQCARRAMHPNHNFG